MPYVPDFGKKMDVLFTYGKSAVTKDQLPEQLNVRPSSMRRYYSQNDVGDAALRPLIELIERELPVERRPDEVQALLLGSYEAFAAAFQVLVPMSWVEFLQENKVIVDAASTLEKAPQALGMAELGDEGPDSSNYSTIRLQQRYRLRFKLPNAGYVLVLENANRKWGAVSYAKDKATSRPQFLRTIAAAGKMAIPAPTPDGRPLFMNEPCDLGMHQFVCIFSRQQFPDNIAAVINEGTLCGAPLLQQLAAFLASLHSGDRRLFVFDCLIVDEHTSQLS